MLVHVIVKWFSTQNMSSNPDDVKKDYQDRRASGVSSKSNEGQPPKSNPIPSEKKTSKSEKKISVDSTGSNFAKTASTEERKNSNKPTVGSISQEVYLDSTTSPKNPQTFYQSPSQTFSISSQSKPQSLQNINVQPIPVQVPVPVPIPVPTKLENNISTNKSDKPNSEFAENDTNKLIIPSLKPPVHDAARLLIPTIKSASLDKPQSHRVSSNPDVLEGKGRRGIKFSDDPPEEFVIDTEYERNSPKGDRRISSNQSISGSVGSQYYDLENEGDSEDDAEILLSNYNKDGARCCSCPNLSIDACLPSLTHQYSSLPEFFFYLANCLNCICAIYMFASGNAAFGWVLSMKSIIIEDDTNPSNHDIESGLGVGGRALFISVMSFAMYLISILGTIGFYHALKPLIYLNLWMYLSFTVLHLLISLSAIATPGSCSAYTQVRRPMLNHINKYYTDSLGVTGEQLYQDHRARIQEMQLAIGCCGADSYKDFEGKDPKASVFRPPYSCCNEAWQLNMACNAETDTKEIKAKISQVGCVERIRTICFNVMSLLGLGGLIFSALLILSLFTSYVCIVYHIRIQKSMAISEIVYAERLNLFMPEIIEDDEQNEDEIGPSDDPTEKKLLINTDKIKLSEKVSQFVDQVRMEYGMDDMVKKRRIIVRKLKKDQIILAPFEMKMAAKRKFSMVAGRHNYFLNRQMLKYAAGIVTTKEGDESRAKAKVEALDEKMKQIRASYRKETADQAAITKATAATSEEPTKWRFKRPSFYKEVPQTLLEHHKEEVNQKFDRIRIRTQARKEKQVRDEANAEENALQRKKDILNRLLASNLN